jgi:predicted membrane channel-forming protein YqfA (hemolysin III family)
MFSRMLTGFMIVCLGLIVMFGFFAVLGLFSPAEVMWLTIGIALLALAVMVHSLRVKHHLDHEGQTETDLMRSLNDLRERRGF